VVLPVPGGPAMMILGMFPSAAIASNLAIVSSLPTISFSCREGTGNRSRAKDRNFRAQLTPAFQLTKIGRYFSTNGTSSVSSPARPLPSAAALLELDEEPAPAPISISSIFVASASRSQFGNSLRYFASWKMSWFSNLTGTPTKEGPAESSSGAGEGSLNVSFMSSSSAAASTLTDCKFASLG
jgi:hypothetical protein